MILWADRLPGYVRDGNFCFIVQRTPKLVFIMEIKIEHATAEELLRHEIVLPKSMHQLRKDQAAWDQFKAQAFPRSVGAGHIGTYSNPGSATYCIQTMFSRD